jgi:predicted nuclease of restriction endonuclease-like (RecB) superfamily
MARPVPPERNRRARSFRQLRRFHHGINSDKVFGTHSTISKPILYGRIGKATTNFLATMGPDRAAQATDYFKDPYVLDFVTLSEEAKERDLEKALVERVSNLLRELGKGFAFIGSQHHIEIGGRDYYLDLLFFHTLLHSYVVVDLKIGDFEPEYAGKMNFYLSAVDDLLRVGGDSPSIGLILCRGKNGLEVEYPLRDLNKPMAVSEYKFLPNNIASELPSPSELRGVGELLEDADLDEGPSMGGPSGSKP